MLKNEYLTSDLALAAALCTVCELERLDRSDSRRVVFIFKTKGGLDKLVEDYWNKRLKVDALSYFNSLKLLKARLYEK